MYRSRRTVELALFCAASHVPPISEGPPLVLKFAITITLRKGCYLADVLICRAAVLHGQDYLIGLGLLDPRVASSYVRSATAY